MGLKLWAAWASKMPQRTGKRFRAPLRRSVDSRRASTELLTKSEARWSTEAWNLSNFSRNAEWISNFARASLVRPVKNRDNFLIKQFKSRLSRSQIKANKWRLIQVSSSLWLTSSASTISVGLEPKNSRWRTDSASRQPQDSRLGRMCSTMWVQRLHQLPRLTFSKAQTEISRKNASLSREASLSPPRRPSTAARKWRTISFCPQLLEVTQVMEATRRAAEWEPSASRAC